MVFESQHTAVNWNNGLIWFSRADLGRRHSEYYCIQANMCTCEFDVDGNQPDATCGYDPGVASLA